MFQRLSSFAAHAWRALRGYRSAARLPAAGPAEIKCVLAGELCSLAAEAKDSSATGFGVTVPFALKPNLRVHIESRALQLSEDARVKHCRQTDKSYRVGFEFTNKDPEGQ